VRSACVAAVVKVPGPQVAGQRDPDAPGDGGDRVRPGAGTAEQPAYRLGDGGEGLVLGELAQPGWHGRGGHEAAAEEGSKVSTMGVLLAVSTVLAARLSAA
jgi:hypothetical protein